jgi:hypothetical protein
MVRSSPHCLSSFDVRVQPFVGNIATYVRRRSKLHSFGVAATKMQHANIADGTWTHTFHLQLPYLTAAQPLQPVRRVNDI